MAVAGCRRPRGFAGRLNLNLLTGSSRGGAGEKGDSVSNEPNGDSEDSVPDSESEEIGSTSVFSVQNRDGTRTKSADSTATGNGRRVLALEEAMALTDAITDFIDADSQRRERGAEELSIGTRTFPICRRIGHWPV